MAIPTKFLLPPFCSTSNGNILPFFACLGKTKNPDFAWKSGFYCLLLFFIKKVKLLKNGEASVCMRITVNGARAETNIRKSIDPASWNQAKECARGKSRKACDLNAYIENAKIKLHQIFNHNH